MKKQFVNFVLSYLRFFAKIALSISKPRIIGIAGSVGKSSTKYAIDSILKNNFKHKTIYGNSETGIPLGILGINVKNYSFASWIIFILSAPFKIFNLLETEILLIEMGIDDPTPPKNMEYLLTILKPDIALSLNVSATHTMQFEKLLHKKPANISSNEFLLEEIAKEDTKIITKSSCSVGIYNADDKYITKILKNSNKNNLQSFGSSTDCDISYKSYDVDISRSKFSFKTPAGELALEFKNLVLPKVYFEVFAPTILVGLALGIEIKKIKESLENNFHLPPGRGSVFKGVKGSIIIDSSYNASKSSVLAFLDLLQQLKKKTGRQSVVVLGDMRELGDLAEKEHIEVAEKLVETSDFTYLVGPLTQKYILPVMQKNNKTTSWFQTSFEAGKYLLENMPENSIVLVKGSQNTIFLEEAVKYLLENTHDEKNLTRQDEYWKKVKSIG